MSPEIFSNSHEQPALAARAIKKMFESDPRAWSTNELERNDFLRMEAVVIDILDGTGTLENITDSGLREMIRAALITDSTNFDELFVAIQKIGEIRSDATNEVIHTPASVIHTILEFRNGRRDPHTPLFMGDPVLEEKVRQLTIDENDSLPHPMELPKAA